MWGVFLFPLAALALVGSLLLGFPIIAALVIALIAGGAWVGAALVRRVDAKPGPPGSSRPEHASGVQDVADAGPAETPSTTR